MLLRINNSKAVGFFALIMPFGSFSFSSANGTIAEGLIPASLEGKYLKTEVFW
jgi:hypothetical protein